MMIRVAGFVKESFTDGVGVRYTIFAQGCKHDCAGCHNPDTHDLRGGSLFEIDKIMDEIKECDYLDGVTLSGGDPLYQASGILKLIKRIKEETTLNIWCYTGFKFEDLAKNKDTNLIEILNNIDVIVDGPFIQELRNISLRFRGSSNQRIIDVKKSLKTGEVRTLID